MALVHLVIITTGINLFILPIFPVPCEGGWARTLLNFSELKKSKSSSCFPSQLSVNRAPRAAHICPGRTRPWRAEESRGRRDCELHRKTYFRPPSRPRHSSAQVKPASLSAVFFFFNVQNNKSIHSKCSSSPTAGCTRKPPSRTCRWMQMKAQLLSRSSSAPLLTDATRNCSPADSGERSFMLHV